MGDVLKKHVAKYDLLWMKGRFSFLVGLGERM